MTVEILQVTCLEHKRFSVNGHFTTTVSGQVSCVEMGVGYLVRSFLLKCVLEDGVIAVLVPAWKRP